MSKDPRILQMIGRFNFSPTAIGYAALTEQLEQFALSYHKAGMTEAADIIAIQDAKENPHDALRGVKYIEAILTALVNRTAARPPEELLKLDANGKAPYLFYYEDAENCWTPAPAQLECILNLDNFSYDGEKISIEFQRSDMTPEQFANLPVV